MKHTKAVVPPTKTGVILNPGFSRVKDLGHIGTRLLMFGSIVQARVPADPREILHGLKAVQDDAVED
jgi:hypothetical protein